MPEKKTPSLKKQVNKLIKRAKKTDPINDFTKKDMTIISKIANRLQEEMSECSKEITKANRFGWAIEHKSKSSGFESGETYAKRVMDEADDVIKNATALKKVISKAQKNLADKKAKSKQ